MALKFNKISPAGDQLAVLPDAVEQIDESEGGIILPDGAKPVIIRRVGTVIAVGPSVDRCVVGDRVLFNGYAGTDIIIGEDDVILMSNHDILAGVE